MGSGMYVKSVGNAEVVTVREVNRTGSVLCYKQGSYFFFFQAEDGIRDRSPSRGLGDVNKIQLCNRAHGRGRMTGRFRRRLYNII